MDAGRGLAGLAAIGTAAASEPSPKLRRPDGFETIQRTEIYLMRADGSNVRQLTHTETYAGSPAFSANP